MTVLELGLIVGMAIVTWLTRIGGLLFPYRQFDPNGFSVRFLKSLPASLLAALVAPKLVQGSAEIWIASSLTFVVVWKSRNTLAGVVAGTVGCAAARFFMG